MQDFQSKRKVHKSTHASLFHSLDLVTQRNLQKRFSICPPFFHSHPSPKSYFYVTNCAKLQAPIPCPTKLTSIPTWCKIFKVNPKCTSLPTPLSSTRWTQWPNQICKRGSLYACPFSIHSLLPNHISMSQIVPNYKHLHPIPLSWHQIPTWCKILKVNPKCTSLPTPLSSTRWTRSPNQIYKRCSLK